MSLFSVLMCNSHLCDCVYNCTPKNGRYRNSYPCGHPSGYWCHTFTFQCIHPVARFGNTVTPCRTPCEERFGCGKLLEKSSESIESESSFFAESSRPWALSPIFPKRCDQYLYIRNKGWTGSGLEVYRFPRNLLTSGNVADVKSLVIHPYTTTHSQLSSEELEAQHITPSTIRLSIGTEQSLYKNSRRIHPKEKQARWTKLQFMSWNYDIEAYLWQGTAWKGMQKTSWMSFRYLYDDKDRPGEESGQDGKYGNGFPYSIQRWCKRSRSVQ